jgi:hypothetical protein
MIANLVECRDAMVSVSVPLLVSGTAGVQRAAYSCLMDMIQLFPRRFSDPQFHPQFHPLGLVVEADVQDQIYTYISETVLEQLPGDSEGGKRKAGKSGGKGKRRAMESGEADGDAAILADGIAELTIEGALEGEEVENKRYDAVEVRILTPHCDVGVGVGV